MLKVLHIGKYFPPFSGGMENFMADLLEEMEKSGIDVAAVVHNHNRHIKTKIIETYKGIRLYKVPCYGQLLYAPVSPQFPFVLDSAIKEFKPDIIHIHKPNTSALWMLLYPPLFPALKNIPIIIHWHSDVVQSNFDTRLQKAYKLYKPFEQRLLKHAHTIIATSTPYLETSSALKNWRHKTVVIPLGLKDNTKQPISYQDKAWAETLWGTGKTRILSIGRLTYYKGHDIFIEALRKPSQIQAIIVGTGELAEQIQKKISAYNLDKKIILTGHLENSKLEALLSSCDCLVLSSIERTEAFGIVLLEAMRAKKPVIVSDVPGSGMGWIVKDAITGFIVPHSNPQLLSKAINKIAANPELAKKLGLNGEDRFKKNFQIRDIGVRLGLLAYCRDSDNKPISQA